MKTVVITTPGRVDRQERIKAELDKLGIPFEFHLATPGTDTPSRALSNQRAHRAVLDANRDQPYLMVLEDDCYFTRHPFEIPLPKGDWWQVYLGANIQAQTFKAINNPGWSILQGAWGAYCIIYSNFGINWIANIYKEDSWINPYYDDYCRGYIHMKGKSLIYNELVARTYPTFSDIDQVECNYEDVIEKSYKFIAR